MSWTMDNTDRDLAISVWVSVDRTQHCLSDYVEPDHPDYASIAGTRRYQKVVDASVATRPAGRGVGAAGESVVTDTEAAEVQEYLRGLGYLE